MGSHPPGKSSRGDIHYRFVLDVPEELTDEQRAAVDALAAVMDGNPRAGLFAQAGAKGAAS